MAGSDNILGRFEMSAPTMDFGLQFFPDVGPDEKSAQAYWNESLTLVGLADELS